MGKVITPLPNAEPNLQETEAEEVMATKEGEAAGTNKGTEPKEHPIPRRPPLPSALSVMEPTILQQNVPRK